YDDYYLAQLKELLTGYGKIFCVWLDGACGEGPGGRPQKYDWNRYYDCIREYQPEACINVCGPDIRWCGNEAGDTRKSEWSVVPAELKDAEKVADKSQKSDDSGFRSKRISSEEQDLGSRERLKNEEDLIWYPAEVNTSIRPGWFYHEKEDDAVKPLAELISIYEKSVGGNATFLLNIPPNKDGLICEADSRRLEELGEYIRKKYGNDLMPEARMITDGNCEKSNDCLVKTKDYSKLPSVFLEWNEEKNISRVVISENICYSQRIERFEIWAGKESEAVKIYSGTTVGYKKIAAFDTVKTRNICIKITDARVSVCIKDISIYE
ncbi:MAG: alpha-L-fucosidase, partial [Lachnospiraceae bacterium]|nr:alpha-L-fucosidase [Lachnospiraceae bacterium]